MAQAYQLIQAQTLTSTATTVTFSNIPQNYTDLVIKVTSRASTGTTPDLAMQFNGSTSGYSIRRLESSGSAVNSNSSNLSSPSGYMSIGITNAAAQTTNTFASHDIYIPNYTSGNYKSVSVDSVTENNASGAYSDLLAGLWSNTSAITSITFAIEISPTFAAGSTFYLYGVGGAKASGGTITADGQYTYHTFTSSGTFTALEKIKNAQVLVIGGGGGGGYNVGGGGGAGGVLWATGQTLTSGTSYSAIVGSGGSAGTSTTTGSKGGDSSFLSFIGLGGGGGGTRNGSGSYPALTGGSGGGSGGDSAGANAGAAASQSGGTNVYAYYGNYGGNGFDYAVSIFAGGGGGGSGVYGETARNPGNSTAMGGKGGDGTSALGQWLYATNTGVKGQIAAGGGGGGAHNASTYDTQGAGGAGGGGNGGSNSNALSATAGTANTGSGGGGGSNSSWPSGAAGGSGLVIVRYPN